MTNFIRAIAIVALLCLPAYGAGSIGGGGITDLNWESDGYINGPPVSILVNIIGDETNSNGTSMTVKQAEIAMSCKGTASPPNSWFYGNCVPDSNVTYLGDGTITDNTCPWTWVTDNAAGGGTRWITFRPVGNDHLPLVRQPNGTLHGVCSFKFKVQVTAPSASYQDPHATAFTISQPTIVNQAAQFRGFLSNGNETSSLYWTQTYIHPLPTPAPCPACPTPVPCPVCSCPCPHQ